MEHPARRDPHRGGRRPGAVQHDCGQEPAGQGLGGEAVPFLTLGFTVDRGSVLSSDALAVPLFKHPLSSYKDPKVPQRGSRRHQVLPSAPSPSRFYPISGVDTSVAISSLGSLGMSPAAEPGEPP